MKQRANTAQVDEETSASRRAAEALHERIDKVADQGERLERKLQEKRERVEERSRELNGSLSKLVHDRPLAVVGGALALGLVVGALSRR